MTFWLWSKTAVSNATADGSVNYREGQGAGSLNDSARAGMAALAKFRDDITGALATSGTSSAYTLTTNQNYNPSAGTVLTDGLTISVRPHATNAAGATLNVDSTAAVPVRTVSGQSIPAGYLIAGTPYRFYYNLSNNEWIVFGAFGNPYGIPIGGFLDYLSTTPPNSNFVLPFGQALSRTIYAALFAMTGTAFGVGDGSTTFNIIDLRGRTIFGLDNMGGTAANRVTTAGCGIDGTTVGAAGGAQSVTLLQSALPNVSSTITITDPGHAHSITTAIDNLSQGGSGHAYGTTGTSGNVHNTNPASTGISASSSSINGNVTQTPVNNMPPCIVLPKLLRVI